MALSKASRVLVASKRQTWRQLSKINRSVSIIFGLFVARKQQFLAATGDYPAKGLNARRRVDRLGKLLHLPRGAIGETVFQHSTIMPSATRKRS